MFLFVCPFLIIFFSCLGMIKFSKNPMFIFIYMELIIIMLSILLVTCLIFYHNSFFGEVYSFFFLGLAAVESALCITLLVLFFSINNSISLNHMNVQFKKS